MRAVREQKYIGFGRAAFLLPLLLLSFRCVCIEAQEPPDTAGDLVRKTVSNELMAENVYFMFRSRKQTRGGSQTHWYVQTRDATAGMLIANNDQPLDAAQRQAEEARLDNLSHNPAELRRKQRQERDDADRITRMVRALPDAFLYTNDGSEPGTAEIGYTGDNLVRLKFRPNPSYDPPSRVEQVLTGMQGILLIDAGKHRIAKIDGTLYKDVSFGWGFFGHLDKGGRFQVAQAQVVDDAWEVVHMGLNFTGKILLFKSLVINSSEVFSDFQKVPNLSFAEGVAWLKKQEAAPVRDLHEEKK